MRSVTGAMPQDVCGVPASSELRGSNGRPMLEEVSEQRRIFLARAIERFRKVSSSCLGRSSQIVWTGRTTQRFFGA